MLFDNVPIELLRQLTLPSMECPKSELDRITEELKAFDFDTDGLCAENSRYRLFRDTDSRVAVFLVLPTPEEPDSGLVHYLFYQKSTSNFAASPITIDVKVDCPDGTVGIVSLAFNCVEAAFQLAKAAYANDWESLELIYFATTPKECKKLGRKIKGLNVEGWKAQSPYVMVELLLVKLEQTTDLQAFLSTIEIKAIKHSISFPDRLYVSESTVEDTFWGTSMNTGDLLKVYLSAPPSEILKEFQAMPVDILRNNDEVRFSAFYAGKGFLGRAYIHAIRFYKNYLAEPRSPLKKLKPNSDAPAADKAAEA